jgi:hypothetical protein
MNPVAGLHMLGIFQEIFLLGKVLQLLSSMNLKLKSMISLCVIPNMKCNNWKERFSMIITCLLCDAIYMVPMIASYVGANR